MTFIGWVETDSHLASLLQNNNLKLAKPGTAYVDSISILNKDDETVFQILERPLAKDYTKVNITSHRDISGWSEDIEKYLRDNI